MNKTDKVGCPTRKCFMYVAACLKSCSRNNKCPAIREFLNPGLLKGGEKKNGIPRA
jgi:hypothetical protein